MGFLGSKWLAQEDVVGSTGNYGLLDQRLAMKWVQENIAVFGGDSTNVTIYGESAGSGSVADHLIMPRSAGLFHAAIMESGPAADWIARTLVEAEQQFAGLGVSVGCNKSNTTPQEVIECLRNTAVADILSASVPCGGTTCCYLPTIDFAEIVDVPATLYSQGHFTNVSVIVGTNMNEGSIFISLAHDATEAEYETYVKTNYGPIASDVLKLYPASNYAAPYWAGVAAWTHSAMTCPARRTARWIASHDGTAYLYYWDHVIQSVNTTDPWLGAFHGVELAFVFHDPAGNYFGLPMDWTPGELELQNAVGTFWTTFGASGNPNPGGNGIWPRFEMSSQQNIVLNTDLSTESFLFNTECNFWDLV